MKQSSLLNWSVLQDRRRWTENIMFSSQINSQAEEGYCEICQWPFSSMKIQTPTKHLERCRKKKRVPKNRKECPSGAICRSKLESHYQLYSHDLLAEIRRRGKPIKPDPVAKGTQSLFEVIDLTSSQSSADEFKTSGSSSSCKKSSPLNKSKLLSPNSSRRIILTGQKTTPQQNRCGGKKLGTGRKMKGSPAVKTEKSISENPWSITKKQRRKLSATTSDCVDLTIDVSSDDDDAVKSVTNCDEPSTSKVENIASCGAKAKKALGTKKRNITTKKGKLGVRRLLVLSSDDESEPEGPKRRKIEKQIHHPNPKFKNPSGGFGSHLVKREQESLKQAVGTSCQRIASEQTLPPQSTLSTNRPLSNLNENTSTDEDDVSKLSETSSEDFRQNLNNKSSSYTMPFVKLEFMTPEKLNTGAFKQKKGLNRGPNLQDDIEIQSTQAQPSDKTKSSASALRDTVGNPHASTTPPKGPSFVPTSPILQENFADQGACLHSDEEDLFSVRSGDLIIDESRGSVSLSDTNPGVCDLLVEDVCLKTADGMEKQHLANKNSNISSDNPSSPKKLATWLLDVNNNSKVSKTNPLGQGAVESKKITGKSQSSEERSESQQPSSSTSGSEKSLRGCKSTFIAGGGSPDLIDAMGESSPESDDESLLSNLGPSAAMPFVQHPNSAKISADKGAQVFSVRQYEKQKDPSLQSPCSYKQDTSDRLAKVPNSKSDPFVLKSDRPQNLSSHSKNATSNLFESLFAEAQQFAEALHAPSSSSSGTIGNAVASAQSQEIDQVSSCSKNKEAEAVDTFRPKDPRLHYQSSSNAIPQNTSSAEPLNPDFSETLSSLRMNKKAEVSETLPSPSSKSNGIQKTTNSDEIQHLDSSMSSNLLLPSPEPIRTVQKDPCKKSDGPAVTCARRLHFDGMKGSKNDILSPCQSQHTSSKTEVSKSFVTPKTTVTNAVQHVQFDVGSPKSDYSSRSGSRPESSGNSSTRTNLCEGKVTDKSNIQQNSPKLKVRCNRQSGNCSNATATTSSNTPSISAAVNRNISCENEKHPQVNKRKKQDDVGSVMFGMEPKYQERQVSEGSMTVKINNSNHNENASGYTRKCPFNKKIAGTAIAVDAFSYGTIKGINYYFLSHFHSDHYVGLEKKSWKHKVYCGRVTGNLLVAKLKLPESLVVRLPMWEEIPLDNVRVTLLEANHCPGAVMFLFKLLNNRVVLHTGDFRAQPEMENYTALQGIKVNTLHLDATNFKPKYYFPSQQDVINAAVTIARNCLGQCKKTLFVVGTYQIGKERIFKALAQAVGSKVFVAADKYRTIKCLEDSELCDLVTENSSGCKVHVLPRRSLHMKDLKSHLAKHSYFKRMVVMKPTARVHTAHNNNLDQIKPVESGQIRTYNLPYSEHSSFEDLRRFVQFLKPDRVIPTFNVEKKSSQDMMNIYLDSWKSGSDP